MREQQNMTVCCQFVVSVGKLPLALQSGTVINQNHQNNKHLLTPCLSFIFSLVNYLNVPSTCPALSMQCRSHLSSDRGRRRASPATADVRRGPGYIPASLSAVFCSRTVLSTYGMFILYWVGPVPTSLIFSKIYDKLSRLLSIRVRPAADSRRLWSFVYV